MHIFLNGLRTDHTKIGSDVVNQLFKSGRTIGRPDMKVSLVRRDLSIVPNGNAFGTVSAPKPQKVVLPPKRIPRQYKISHIIGTQYEQPTLMLFVER